MKRIFRHFAIDTFSLYVASLVASGLVFESGFTTMAMAGAALTVAGLVVKPVINILLLPLNLITFNLFKWLSSAVALYLVTLVVNGFRIEQFVFNGYSSVWFDIPAINFTGVLAIAAFSIIISFVSSIILWIVK